MKVKKVVELKPQFNFEAPVMPAQFPVSGEKIKTESLIDLNKFLAPKPDECFLVRVSGESMINEGIFDGDVLVVNRREQAKNGSIVIAALNGEMTVKTLREIEGKIYLFSANDKFLPIEIKPFWEFKIQGVVKYVIHDENV